LKLEATLSQQFPSTKVVFYAADLSTAAAVDKLFADVLKEFGRIDIVVNTIGMVLKKPISDISEEEYDKMFAYVYPGIRPCSPRPNLVNVESILRLHSSF
jgi:NAD(P)-dependent dehydrogenase (short-subunit alcohol dehydrogenase family)